MAETPKCKLLQSPKKPRLSPNPNLQLSTPPSVPLTPQVSQALAPLRRSSRRLSLRLDPTTQQKHTDAIIQPAEDSLQNPRLVTNGEKTDLRTPQRSLVGCAKEFTEDSVRIRKPLSKEDCLEILNAIEERKPREASKLVGNGRKSKQKDQSGVVADNVSFSPVSPDQSERKKRKKGEEKIVMMTRSKAARNLNPGVRGRKKDQTKSKKRVYYKKVLYDGGDFEVGNDVYVKRREDASSDEDPEVEECRVCYKSGTSVMIECDDCLGGFHLKCLKPPLKEIPEGDWICGFCEARRLGKQVEFPKPPEGKKRVRTLREKLLSSALWAARIESLWKEIDGSYWIRGRWYMIPEETSAGRQPHNLRRELYLTNDYADIEMESIIRHCFVKNPKEFAKANNEGDDIFICEYVYDIHWHSFKRLADIDNDEEDAEDAAGDEDWNSCYAGSDTDEDIEYDEENVKNLQTRQPTSHELAANSRKGRFFGIQKVGSKRIPEHVRCHKQTELERAKATLLLSTLPKSLPCRNKEMEEITAFVKGAICDDQCLGRCLYIHGVPGTGKTMSVLSVMRNLKSEVDAGSVRPYCFVEINGLKLASPENIYQVIYDALTGHRVSWKKALHLLNERFIDGQRIRKEDNRPCILLIDELDLLVTRNQSVLYNILDWPTKPHSKLVVIGIANTMDLPEKLLPRISSRMGIQRLCFGPYNHQQLQEIIFSRLKGVDAFEKQAIEFASRKVAAISGDARRALEICRRAAEIADYRIKKQISLPNMSGGKSLVAMADVEAAIQEMFQAPHIQVMRSCSKLSKIFLTAMVHELYKTGMAETTFDKLAMTISYLCTSNAEAFPGWDLLLKIGCNLGECRILICEPGAKHRLQKLQLNFPSDDVTFALKDNKEVPWLAKYL